MHMEVFGALAPAVVHWPQQWPLHLQTHSSPRGTDQDGWGNNHSSGHWSCVHEAVAAALILAVVRDWFQQLVC